MRLRTLHLPGLVLLIALVLSACGPAAMPDPHLRITSPRTGAVIVVSQTASDPPGFWHWSPGVISVSVDTIPRTDDPACEFPILMWEPSDNGGGFRGIPISDLHSECSVPSGLTATYSWIPDNLGLHTITSHLTVLLNNGTSYRFDSNSITVCVINDQTNPARNISTGTVGPTCNPPTPTPVPTIRVRPNPNQHGEGCSQYGDLTSCNLAGCSWQGGACVVNP